MSDIFREVDEALQQEKIEKIWKEYRSTIIAAVAILIVSTAATTAYKSWNAGRNAEETARLIQAMESDKPAEAIKDVIGDTRNSHESLAMMSNAGMLLDQGKTAEAAAIYKRVADNKSTPRDFRDLARLLYTQHADKPDIDILKPVLANEKSPWVWHARLQAAVIAGEQNNDTAQALEYLKPFDSVTTIPLSLKQRAQALEHVYTLSQPNVEPAAGETK
ncbi:MAG TPA: tetratricopeptide repeat protein [Alphaproteobacteria bacterium]|nr:tetratricopeptide repeat protein [Alphaproteobacteria bacterium]